jgi:hypothetical protein
MSRSRFWMRVAAVVLSAAVPLMSGCAGFLVAQAVATAVSLSKEPRWGETNRRTFANPADDVYAVVVQEVERNGRKIVERDAPSRSLRVSYPFSALTWGGSLRIMCIPSEFGTTVIVMGDGRDAVSGVRAVGDEVLADADRALRRQPRML